MHFQAAMAESSLASERLSRLILISAQHSLNSCSPSLQNSHIWPCSSPPTSKFPLLCLRTDSSIIPLRCWNYADRSISSSNFPDSLTKRKLSRNFPNSLAWLCTSWLKETPLGQNENLTSCESHLITSLLILKSNERERRGFVLLMFKTSSWKDILNKSILLCSSLL